MSEQPISEIDIKISKPTVKDLNLELTKLKKNLTDLNHKYELLAKNVWIWKQSIRNAITGKLKRFPVQLKEKGLTKTQRTTF